MAFARPVAGGAPALAVAVAVAAAFLVVSEEAAAAVVLTMTVGLGGEPPFLALPPLPGRPLCAKQRQARVSARVE